MDFFRVRARNFFGFRHGPAGASLPSRLPEHQALLQPVAGAPELHEPAGARDAADDRRRGLVVGEDGAPPAGLDVGGGYGAPPLVALGYHLAGQPRPVHVEGDVAEYTRPGRGASPWRYPRAACRASALRGMPPANSNTLRSP